MYIKRQGGVVLFCVCYNVNIWKLPIFDLCQVLVNSLLTISYQPVNNDIRNLCNLYLHDVMCLKSAPLVWLIKSLIDVFFFFYCILSMLIVYFGVLCGDKLWKTNILYLNIKVYYICSAFYYSDECCVVCIALLLN